MDRKHLKILAIDDNQELLDTLQGLLDDLFPGATVFTATSGQAGIKTALTEDPDVILLDILISGMDGFEVCRAIKRRQRISHIPVVFLTALESDPDIRAKALAAGVEGFLSKPLNTAELTAQIRVMAQVKTANESKRRETDRLAELVAERTCELQKMLAEQKDVEETLQQQADELRQRNSELGRFNRAAVGRELRMIELKQEVNELCRHLGEVPRYTIPGERYSSGEMPEKTP